VSTANAPREDTPPEVPATDSRPPTSDLYAWYVVGVLMLANVSSFVDRQILAFLVDPIKADLRISDTAMSLLLGSAFAITYSITGFPIGRLADRRSRRAIIGWGIATWSVMCAMSGFARNYLQLFLARVGVGVGEATLSPPAFSLIADYFPPRRLAAAMSIFGTGIFLGAGLAYFIGGTIIEAFQDMQPWHLPVFGEMRPWQSVLLVVGAPGLLIALLMLTVREPPRTFSSGGVRGGYSVRETLMYMRDHIGAFSGQGLGIAVFSLVNYATAMWFPAYFARAHGWSQGKIGLYMGLATMIFGTVGIILGGRLAVWMRARRSDANLRIAIAGALLAIPAAFPLYLSSNQAWLVAGLIITNVASAFPWGAASAAVQEMTPAPMRGQASALYLFLINIIGFALGPPAVALLTDGVFHDEMMVGYSLFIVTLVGRTLSAGVLALGLAPFRRAVAAAGTWVPVRS
jgi:MFS family permease